MKFFTFLIILIFSIPSIAQQSHGSILFNPTINKQAIEIGKKYYSSAITDSVHFEAILFYISDLQFFQDEQLVFTQKKKHLLIDVEKPESLKIDLDPNSQSPFNNIKFNIGIDSLTNVSGAFGDDLDPTNGMYWTWQSGYINFKLEGVSKSCPARNHLFQFHLGGYQGPFNALQNVSLETFGNKNITIDLAIDQFFEKINVETSYQVMSPSQQAVEMTELVATIFSTSKQTE